MAAALEERYEGIESRLIESGGGAFEVTVDGKPIFSKLETHRHPTHEELFVAIDALPAASHEGRGPVSGEEE